MAEAEDMYHYVDLAAGQWHELAEIYAACAPALEAPPRKTPPPPSPSLACAVPWRKATTAWSPARDNPNFQNLIQRCADFQQLP